MEEAKIKRKSKKEKEKEKVLPLEAAGHIMSSKIPTVLPSATIKEIRTLLSEKDFETINYIYAIDKKGRLKGVLSVKDALRLPEKKKMEDVMTREPISLSIYANQEHVALTALKYNIKAIPVVDVEEKLLGVVPSDTILSVLHDENLEDILYSAGFNVSDDSGYSIMKASVKTHIVKRLPWLIVGLIGGMLAAFVVDYFEQSIRVELALAAFIPAVVYMSDAVGSQSQTIFIRSLALDHRLNLKKYVYREINVNLVLATLLGSGFYVAAFFWTKSVEVSLIVGISVFLTILTAMMVAMFMPWILEKRKYDPAIASGPFATVVRDLTSLLIYFSVARIVLTLFA